MAMKEIDALGDAIVATEKEIAAEAWGLEELTHDETGDRSREAMGEGLEGQHEPDDDDDEPESDEGEGAEDSKDGKTVDAKDGKDGQVRDDKGKFAAKDDKDGKSDKDEPDPAKAGEGKTEPEGRVPPGKHREVAERARTAEAERDTLKTQLETERTNWRKDFDTMKAQMDGVLAALQRPQPAPKPDDQPKVETPPDPLDNPQGFAEHLTKGFQTEISRLEQQRNADRVEMSMQIAADRHGEAFTKAFEAVSQLNPRNPDDQVTVRRIYSSPNPGKALVDWHKRNETLREVGEDPAAYRTRIASETREALMKDPEFRKQLIESLQAEASGADGGKPRTQVRLPRSLNGAAGGNAARDADPLLYDDSERAVAESAWS